MARIVTRNLSFSYQKGVPLFEKLDLDIGLPDSGGAIIAIVGKSGCGKSTLLRLLAGADKPALGSVEFFPPGPQVALMAQDPIVFDHLSVTENATYFKNVKAVAKRIGDKDLKLIANELGLAGVLSDRKKMDQISGGERQRVALMRALSVSPDLLCLDEPASGLDVGVKRDFLLSLRSSVRRRNILALYVTHHAEEAELIADLAIFIHKGIDGRALVFKNTVPSLIDSPPHPSVRQFFGGPSLNILDCSMKDGLLKSTYSNEVLGRGDVTVEVLGGKILFPPERVKWSEKGVPVEWVSNSGCFGIAQISAADVRSGIIGPRAVNVPSAFLVEGAADLFRFDGQFVSSINLR